MGAVQHLSNIPTNLVMGFLGVGKTTAILDLLKHKPIHQNWAVLVNEFGKVGIDGAIYSAAGVSVQEIAGGCLCCAVGLPFQVSINRLIKEVKPDRLLIEPTGLGHPKKVIDMLLTGSFKETLDLKASICLVDPQQFKNSRYTKHQNFIDQIALCDILVANKMDLADQQSIQLFHQWGKNSNPEKTLIAETRHGQLDIGWLDISRNPQRQALFPNAHQISKLTLAEDSDNPLNNKADGYQSFGHIFPTESCFDYSQLSRLLNQLKVERIKAIINTNHGWYTINGTQNIINYIPSPASSNSRIEIITSQPCLQATLSQLNQCRVA